MTIIFFKKTPSKDAGHFPAEWTDSRPERNGTDRTLRCETWSSFSLYIATQFQAWFIDWQRYSPWPINQSIMMAHLVNRTTTNLTSYSKFIFHHPKVTTKIIDVNYCQIFFLRFRSLILASSRRIKIKYPPEATESKTSTTMISSVRPARLHRLLHRCLSTSSVAFSRRGGVDSRVFRKTLEQQSSEAEKSRSQGRQRNLEEEYRPVEVPVRDRLRNMATERTTKFDMNTFSDAVRGDLEPDLEERLFKVAHFDFS